MFANQCLPSSSAGSNLRGNSVKSALPRHQIPPSAPSSGNSHKRPHERGLLPPSGAYAYGAGVVADTLLTFLKEAPCHDVLSHFNSRAGDPRASAPQFCVEVAAMPVPGASYRGRIFDQLSRMPCEVVMNAKTIGLILAIILLTIPVLACGGTGGGSDDSGDGGATSRVGGDDDEVLKLLPEDTTRIRVAAADAITGGSVPESMAGLFEAEWERYSLGGEDEIVTIDDIGKIVWAYFPDGAIMMLGGSRMDFVAINQWLADEDTNIGKRRIRVRKCGRMTFWPWWYCLATAIWCSAPSTRSRNF